MPVSDDEIIRRRLLMDGDSGADDKRINNLIKVFFKWSDPAQPDQGDAVYQRLVATLAQCDYTMEKSVLVNEMNTSEQEHYASISRDIEAKLQEATKMISDAKEELQKAKRIRKYKQEYDGLAKVILQQPDRLDSHRKLKELEEELNNLKISKEALEKKLEMRRKQFLVLLSSLHELIAVIKDDEEPVQDDVAMS